MMSFLLSSERSPGKLDKQILILTTLIASFYSPFTASIGLLIKAF